MPRSDVADSYYTYDVVAVGFDGARSSAARAGAAMPNVVGICSWSMWQMLRAVGFQPSEVPAGIDPEGRTGSRVAEQGLSVGSVHPAGTFAGVRVYT